MSEKQQSRKRGVRDVGIVIVAAALIMIPSFVGRIAFNRLKLPMSMTAVVSFALFLIGVFLLLKILKD